MARGNESAASCALTYAADHAALTQMGDDERSVVEELSAHGFFDERPLPQNAEEFRPVQVTLFPTNRCNLRCSYCYASDPRSQRFFFGSYDAQAGGFAFDRKKLKELAELNVRNFPYCRDCFCKWHCAGDCAAKVLDGIAPHEHAGCSRCEVNRARIETELYPGEKTWENAPQTTPSEAYLELKESLSWLDSDDEDAAALQAYLEAVAGQLGLKDAG